jgi:hypothetical protein
MNKQEIEKAARKLVELIDTTEADFAKWVKKNQRIILDAIVAEFNDAPTEKGRLTSGNEMRKFIAALPTKVRAALKKTGFTKKVTDYVRTFEDMQQLQIDLHKTVNGINAATAINSVRQKMVDLTVSNMVGQGMDNMFITPLQNKLSEHSTVGVSLKDMVTSMKDFINGNPNNQNTTFTNYSLQIGRDAIGQYDGLVNQKIANQFDLNALIYVGSVVEDSRPQCERWLEKEFILISDLADEIDWAFSNGSGMIAGTTADNFTMFRGGYNCRHQAIPIRVSEEQIAAGTLDITEV